MTEQPDMNSTKCQACGMPTRSFTEYHPFAACAIFEQTRNSSITQKNLRAVVEYGMRAQRLGVSLEAAMQDLTKVMTQ